jgi:hypothetical protein
MVGLAALAQVPADTAVAVAGPVLLEMLALLLETEMAEMAHLPVFLGRQ